MRLLVVDNGTKQLDALTDICAAGGKREVTTVTAEQYVQDLAGTGLDGFDAIVLSGDYENGLAWEQSYFLRETELVMDTAKPILGIGLGFELILYAAGYQLHEVAERTEGATRVVPTEDGSKVFQGTDPIIVADGHRWNIDELPKGFVALAKSETGIEAIRHKTKLMYGLQLHPENFKYSSDAKMVFENIFEVFAKNVSQ